MVMSLGPLRYLAVNKIDGYLAKMCTIHIPIALCSPSLAIIESSTLCSCLLGVYRLFNPAVRVICGLQKYEHVF